MRADLSADPASGLAAPGNESRPHIVLIMQARMGSSRLPGKSLMPLAGEPLVSRVVERVKRCRRVDTIVLATTDKSPDDSLAELAKCQAVAVFRGSENDLVDRYYQAALAHHADVVVRVPADNPAPEPAEIDRIIDYHLASGNDFSSNYPDVFDNGYPDGIGAEAFNFQALKQVWETSADPRNREHPHTNFYEHPEVYRIGTIECPPEFRRPDIILDVNTQEEYEFMAELYDYLYPRNPEFSIRDIIRWYDEVYRRKEKL
jgi:spore coat polysaccharide biosynthesis protein SpsF